MGLDSASKFAATRTTLDGSRDDDAEFDATMRGMEGLRFTKHDRESLLAMVSAILHLSNIEIREDTDWDGNPTAELDVKNPSLNYAARLLKVSAEELKEGLCTRIIVTGRETTRKPETREKAMLSRDALCKSLYSKMFDRIVRLINDSLKAGIDAAQARGAAREQANVSVLDIFGFESFEKNHFEQLCINHANERLQLHFNHFTFLQERVLLEAEGLQLSESDFTDNAACVALLEDGWGIQATLDDVCKMPKGDDKALLERLSSAPAIRDHPHFNTPKKKNGTFVVRHYAGDVAYSVDGMVERNKDTLPASVVELMQRSQNPTFASAYDTAESEAAAAPVSRGSQREGAGKMGGRSVYAQFKADLRELLSAIEASNPHFVRCINPNAEKRADYFVDLKAVEQLRCGGVIEAVRMARESFPSRSSFESFCQSYVSMLCPDIAKSLPAKSKCLACMKVLGADPSTYFIGKSMILLRREVLEVLDRRRSDLLRNSVIRIQSHVRRKLFQVQYAQRKSTRAAVRVQSYFRRIVTRAKYIVLLKVTRARAAAEIQEAQAKAEVARRKDAELAEAAKRQQLEKAQVAKNQEMDKPKMPKQQVSEPRQEKIPSQQTAKQSLTAKVVNEHKGLASAAMHDSGGNSAALEESMRLMMQSHAPASGKQSLNSGAAIGRYGTLGSNGWVSTKDGLWLECELLDQNDSHLTLRLSNGVQTMERRACKFCVRNPDNVEAIDDFLKLPYLDEPNILNSLVCLYLKHAQYLD